MKTKLFLATALLVFAANAGFGAEKKSHAKADPAKPRVITLEDAYDITLRTDQSIKIAYYQIRSANLLPLSALTQMGPSLTGNASYNIQRNNASNSSNFNAASVGGMRIQNMRLESDTRFWGFSYQQPIFNPSVFPAYRYGKLSAKAARLQQQYTVRQVLFGVAQAYYDVLKQQKLVEVNKETVELAGEQLKTAQARYDAGAVARIDVLRAQASLEEARNALIILQGQEEIARNTLSNILNFGGKTNFTLVEPPDARNREVPFEEALGAAYQHREDYKVSAISIEQTVAQRGQVIAQYGPQVVLNANTTWASTSGAGSGINHESDATIGVSMPFLTGGQRELDLINSNFTIAQAKLNYEMVGKSIENEVRTAWVNVKTGKESILALEADVQANTQNYKDTEAQYQAGTATSLDVQVSLRDLNSSRSQLASNIYTYQIALRDLLRAEAKFQNERVRSVKFNNHSRP